MGPSSRAHRLRRLTFNARTRLAEGLAPPGLRHLAGRYIRSVAEVLSDRSISAHVRSIERLAPASISEYPFDDSFDLEYARSKAFDERSLIRLSDVRLYPASGIVQLPDGRVIGESFGSLSRILHWGGAAHELSQPHRERIDQPVVAVPDTGYFHWLLEVLPAALHALHRSPDAAVVTTPTAAQYVDDALALLMPDRTIIRAEAPVDVADITFAAISPYSGFVYPQDIDILRSTVLPHVPPSSDDERAIYVSRRGSSRSLGNESEIERALVDIGYRVVRNEDLSFRDQVAIFRGAQIIAGPHGAGLANLVWADDLRTLIEVFEPDHFNACYARLAVAQASRYEALRADPAQGSKPQIAAGQISGIAQLARDQQPPR